MLLAQSTRRAALQLPIQTLSLRTFATQPPPQAPTESSTNPSKANRPTSSLPLYAGLLALGAGGALYYFSQDEHRADLRKVEHDVAHEVEHRAEEAYGAAKARSSELAHRAGDRFDEVKKEGRGVLKRGEEEVGDAKRRAEVEKGNWRGSATAEKDAVARQFEEDKAAVKAKAGELKKEGRSWLSWGGSKVDEGKGAAKDAVNDAERSASNLAFRASSELDREKELAKSKAEDLKQEGKSALDETKSAAQHALDDTKTAAQHAVDDANRTASNLASRASSELEREKSIVETKAHEAKEVGSNWWSWGSSKSAEAVDATKQSALNAVDATKQTAIDAATATKDAAASYAETTKETASYATGAMKDAGVGAKDVVKEGLLAAERATERGAQKAQEETKKL